MSLGCPVCLTLTSSKGRMRWRQLGQSRKGVLLRVCHQVCTKTATTSSKNSVCIIFGGLDTSNCVMEFQDSSFFLSSFPLLCREAWLPGEIAWNIFNKDKQHLHVLSLTVVALLLSHWLHFLPVYVTPSSPLWSRAVSIHSHILWRQWRSQESPKTTGLTAYDGCLFLVSSWRLGEMGLGLVVWPFLCKTQLTRLRKIIVAPLSEADQISPLLDSLQAGPIPCLSPDPLQVSPAGWDMV